MDAKTKTRKVNALMTKFIQLYEDKYGQKPKFNRHTEKWGFEYMLDDLGIDAQATLEYYFTLKRNHTSQDFLRNYHEIGEWRREDEDDEANRRKLAEETKQRVEEHRARWEQKPST
jgi:hypothetical protein